MNQCTAEFVGGISFTSISRKKMRVHLCIIYYLHILVQLIGRQKQKAVRKKPIVGESHLHIFAIELFPLGAA